MAESCNLSCGCGRTTWVIKDKALGRHIKCYCDSCQSAVRHLGKSESYLDNGGTQLFQTVPYNFEITSGHEHVVLMRLSPKGLFRWYTACCNTPLSNTLPKPGFPFASAILPVGHKDFGRVTAHVNTEAAPKKTSQTGLLGTVLGVLSRALVTRLSGKAKITPFFDDDGTPIMEPRVLTLEQRKAARA